MPGEVANAQLEALDPQHFRNGGRTDPIRRETPGQILARRDAPRPEARVLAQAPIAIHQIGLRGDQSMGIRRTEPSYAEG